MAACLSCGKNLGLVDRLTNGGKCGDCAKREREALSSIRTSFESLLNEVATGTQLFTQAKPQLTTLFNQAVLSAADISRLQSRTMTIYGERVLADDLLNEQEEEEFVELATFVGVTSMQAQYPQLLSRLLVARVNDGRLPVIDQPSLLAKPRESVHLETTASLVKEVAIKEYRGASHGVSFRIAKGVHYRVGAQRGKMVQVGTEMVIEDEGILSITSQRAVFMGRKTTIEVAYNKLAGLEMYSDGVRFNITNRKTAPLLKLTEPDAVGAVLNAAVQRLPAPV